MDKIEQGILFMYTALVSLYPRGFRRDFEAEMRSVFSQALRAARYNGLRAVLQLCSRELSELPRSLLHEHWASEGEKEVGMKKNMRFKTSYGDPDPDSGKKKPAHSWGEIALAALPFVLLLLIDAVPMSLVETGLLASESPVLRGLINALTILAGVIVVGMLIVSWRFKWPLWSASWYLFFIIIFALAPVSWLLSKFFEQELYRGVNLQSIILYQLIPLMIAALLYAVTRLDRLRGLLSALPVLYILWLPNMEFVPDPIELSIKIGSTVLICLVITFLLRQGDWRMGLYAVLAENMIVGTLFSYAGIYHGGSLPFTAPGANLVEVSRSMIPQFLATGAILLGPLFALKIRQAGRAGGRVGTAGYHLALLGLLLVIVSNLASLMMTIDAPSRSIPIFSRGVLTLEIILGLGAYLVGLFMVWGVAQSSREASVWVERLLLVFLPLVIPFALISPFITWRVPVNNLYGIPVLWELPHALSLSLGLIWFFLSVWLVTRDSADSTPAASLGEPSGAPLLS